MNCEHSGATLGRMCSCCRKPIANGTESLILNGMYAHVACVAIAMAEPWSMEQVTDDHLRAEINKRGLRVLSEVKDDVLRAECERRGIERGCEASYDYGTIVADRDHYRKLFEGACARLEDTKRERDELKRRAEVAEALLAVAPSHAGRQMAINPDHPFLRDGLIPLTPDMRPMRISRAESGPGIAAKPPQSEPLAFLDEDLLCEDA